MKGVITSKNNDSKGKGKGIKRESKKKRRERKYFFKLTLVHLEFH